MNPIVRLLNDMTKYGLEKVGLFYSKYRGFVYDRDDPEGYGRLKVSVPEVYGDMVADVWAWPANNYSGNGYGAQVIPKRNDLVWVEFEKGNPRKPLWSFGYFAKDEKPENLKDVNNYWFKTPAGLLVELDDTNKLIRVTNTEGLTFVFDQDSMQLLDGQYGGLAIVSDIVERLNNIEDDNNDLKTVFNSWVIAPSDGGAALKAAAASWAGSSLTNTTAADIENPQITHGE